MFKQKLFQPSNSTVYLCSILIILLNIFSFQVKAEKQAQINSIKYEYATFYMETEGEFVVPVIADAPAIYSWSEPGFNIKGDIPEIWKHLSIKSDIEYSFTNIENIILNHVANMNWELRDLAITSVPLAYNPGNFRTAYRYVFRRPK